MADEQAKPEDDKSLLQKFGGVMLDFSEWLAETLGRNRAMQALADDLGGKVKPDAPAYPKPTLDGIKAFVEAPHPGIESWIGVIADLRKLAEAIRAVAEAIEFGPEAAIEEVTQSLIDLLASNYVRERWFHLYVWMEFARFATEPMTLFGPQGTARQRFYGSLKALVKFALAPLKNLAGPAMKTEADARKWSDSTLLHLAAIFAFVGRSERVIGLDFDPTDERPLADDDRLLKMYYGWDQPAGSLSQAQITAPIADDISERMLSVQLRSPPKHFQKKSIKVEGALRATLAWVPEDHGGKGLFVALGGSSFRFNVALAKKWAAQAEARFDAPFSVLLGGPDDFRIDAPLGEGQVHIDLAIASQPLPGQQYAHRLSLGGENGFHVGRLALSAALDNKGAEAQLAFYDCRLALDGSSFDDFIGSLLPKTQTSVEFSFGVGVSTKDGVFTTGDLPFVGSRGAKPQAAPRALAAPARAAPLAADTPPASDTADDPPLPGGAGAPSAPPVLPPDLPVISSGVQGGGIPIKIPIGKSLGPVRLHDVLLNVDRDTEGESPRTLIGAALSFSAQIGPVLARVDRIGMKFALDFPDDRSKANLHFANLDIGFIPPAGIGLAVETEQVRGGGFLFHDEAKHQYAGVMELSLSGIIALKAIGILTTKLPNNTRGYSLLILITLENSNPNTSLLELPMGWRLTGIGGLLALHRTASEEALRAGVRNRTLESVLFPKDPVKNAPTVIAALDRVFPIQHRSYLLGVMARFEWGVPTIIRVDLALIVEFGNRGRVFVLGRIQSILPRVDHDLLRLNLDAIGIFSKESAEIDAVLVDSRLLNRFPITGAAALRARWTSPRSFALAVGGMNRGFNPPTGFPTLERVAISLTTGDNPRLVCEGYFAVTSNTVQYGAYASFYAAALGFNVQGEIGYDVLIRLVPFHFLAEFVASMQLRKGSKNLFKVKVEGALEGPVPLALRAKCTFEILWWDVSIRVNVTLVGGAKPAPPPAVEPTVILRSALNDQRSWSAELPAGQSRIVVLRDAAPADGGVRVHPLGTLAVRQSVVPLNLDREIDKFGESPVVGARRFAVTGVAVGGAQEQTSALSEDFAPGQFFEMSDEARIASPSFEPMQAGVRIGSSDFALGFAERIESPLEYETRIVDRSAGAPPPAPVSGYRLSVTLLAMQALHGAAGLSVLRREQPTAMTPFAAVETPRWSAVADDLAPLPGGKRDQTFVEALGTRRGERQGLVVRDFELRERVQ